MDSSVRRPISFSRGLDTTLSAYRKVSARASAATAAAAAEPTDAEPTDAEVFSEAAAACDAYPAREPPCSPGSWAVARCGSRAGVLCSEAVGDNPHAAVSAKLA